PIGRRRLPWLASGPVRKTIRNRRLKITSQGFGPLLARPAATRGITCTIPSTRRNGNVRHLIFAINQQDNTRPLGEVVQFLLQEGADLECLRAFAGPDGDLVRR